jgi:hypothetical protein
MARPRKKRESVRIYSNVKPAHGERHVAHPNVPPEFLFEKKEQIVGVNELGAGDGRWFRKACKASCLETGSQHIAWIAEDHHHACS